MMTAIKAKNTQKAAFTFHPNRMTLVHFLQNGGRSGRKRRRDIAEHDSTANPALFPTDQRLGCSGRSGRSGHLAYLESLYYITANPELFPTTSD